MSARSTIGRAAVCAIFLGASIGPVFAGTSSFDSVQEFGATQGAGNWQYGYYTSTGDAGSFVLMSYYDSFTYTGNAWSESQVHPPYTSLWAEGGHPNGFNSGPVHDPVRRWTSGVDGVVQIAGTFSTTTVYGSTLVGVIVDNTLIWSALASGYSQQTFELSHLVSSGSQLDFFINSNGLDYDDSTNFAFVGQVNAIPEPETYAMALGGLVAVLSLIRRRKVASTR